MYLNAIKGKKLHNIGKHSEEVKDKLDGILTNAYPLMSQGLGWSDAIEEKPDGKGNLHFEVLPRYLSENAVAILTVCSEQDVIVVLSRKIIEQKALAYHAKFLDLFFIFFLVLNFFLEYT